MVKNELTPITHKDYGVGVVVAMNRLEDKTLRVCVVWQDTVLAGVICGWYLFEDPPFTIGK
jgi:hypothetical protein